MGRRLDTDGILHPSLVVDEFHHYSRTKLGGVDEFAGLFKRTFSLGDEEITVPLTKPRFPKPTSFTPRFELAEETLVQDENQEYNITSLGGDSSRFHFYDEKTDEKILSVIRDHNNNLCIIVYTDKPVNFFVDIEADNVKILGPGCSLYFADKVKAKKLRLEALSVTLADQAELSAESGAIKVGEFYQIDEAVKTSLQDVSMQAGKMVLEAGEFDVRDSTLNHTNFYQTGGRASLTETTVDAREKFYLGKESDFQAVACDVHSAASTFDGEFIAEKSSFVSDEISGHSHALKAKQSKFSAKTMTFDKAIDAADETLFQSDECSIYGSCDLRHSAVDTKQLRTGESTSLRATHGSTIAAETATLHNTKVIESALVCKSFTSHNLTAVRAKVEASVAICEDETAFYAGSDVRVGALTLADQVVIQESSAKTSKELVAKEGAQVKIGARAQVTVEHDSKLFGDVTLGGGKLTSNVINVFGSLTATPSSQVRAYRLDVYGRGVIHSNCEFAETYIESGAVLSFDGQHFTSSKQISNQGSFFSSGYIITPLLIMADNGFLQATMPILSIAKIDMQSGSQFRFDQLKLDSKSFNLGEGCLLRGAKGKFDVNSFTSTKESQIDVSDELELTGGQLGLEADIIGGKVTLGFDDLIYGFNGGVSAKELYIYTPMLAYTGTLDAETLTTVILLNLNAGYSEAWQANEKSLFSLSAVSMPRLPENKRDIFSGQSLLAVMSELSKCLPKELQAAFGLAKALYSSGKLSYSYLTELYQAYQLKSRELAATSSSEGRLKVARELTKDMLQTVDDARTWEWLKGLSAAHAAYETATQTLEAGKSFGTAVKERREAKAKATKAKEAQAEEAKEKEEASKEVAEAKDKNASESADSSDQSAKEASAQQPTKPTAKPVTVTDRLVQAAAALEKHQDSLFSVAGAVGPSRSISSLATVNLGPTVAASVTRKHGCFVNVGGETAVSSSLDVGSFYNYGRSTSVFSSLTTKRMLNRGEFTAKVADWDVGVLAQQGKLTLGSDLRDSSINIREAYRSDGSRTTFRRAKYTGDFMAATQGSHLHLHDVQADVGEYIDAGRTTFAGANKLAAPKYSHAGSYHQVPEHADASLHLITDTPHLYGSADIAHLQLTLGSCTTSYAQDFYNGRHRSASYNPTSSLRLNLLDTDFTYTSGSQRECDLFVTAPHIDWETDAMHSAALGFTATAGGLTLNHDIAAREVYLWSLSGNVTNYGQAVLANNYLEVRAPQGYIYGLARVNAYQGRYDTQADYDPAVFMGGDGVGHDGLGLYLEADGLYMRGSDLLSGSKGVVEIKRDAKLGALTHTYISNFKAKHYGGKSLWQKGFSWQMENLLRLDAPFYKQSVTTSTQVQNCRVQSFGDRFVFHVGGNMDSTATLFDSHLGTQVFAGGDVNFYALQTRDKTRTLHSGFWGLNERKRKEILTSARPNVLRSQPDGDVTVVAQNDIYSHGTSFQGAGADLRLEAGRDLTLERALDRRQSYANSRGISFSCPGYDSYQAYRNGGGWRGAVGAFDPTAKKIMDLCGSKSVPQWLANSFNVGVNGFNTASSIGGAIKDGRLGGTLMERWGLGGTQRAGGSCRGFDPSFTLTYRFNRKKGFSESLGAGGFDMNKVRFKAGGTITTTNAFGGHAHGDMDVEATDYVVKGAQFRSASTSKSEEVSVSITASGQATPGGGFERKKSSSRQVATASTTVDGNLRIHTKTLDAKDAKFRAGSMDGTQIEHTRIRTTTSSSRSKGVGLKVKGKSVTPSLHRASERTVGTQSGFFVEGDLTDADFGATELVGSVITAGGENKAHFDSIKAKSVKSKSSSFGLEVTIDGKALSKSERAKSAAKGTIPTIPVKPTIKTSSQQAKAVVHGRKGTSPTVRGTVEGKLHTKSSKGVSSHRGANIDVAVDVPVFGRERVKQASENIKSLLPARKVDEEAGVVTPVHRVLDEFEGQLSEIIAGMRRVKAGLEDLSDDMYLEKSLGEFSRVLEMSQSEVDLAKKVDCPDQEPNVLLEAIIERVERAMLDEAAEILSGYTQKEINEFLDEVQENVERRLQEGGDGESDEKTKLKDDERPPVILASLEEESEEPLIRAASAVVDDTPEDVDLDNTSGDIPPVLLASHVPTSDDESVSDEKRKDPGTLDSSSALADFFDGEDAELVPSTDAFMLEEHVEQLREAAVATKDPAIGNIYINFKMLQRDLDSGSISNQDAQAIAAFVLLNPTDEDAISRMRINANQRRFEQMQTYGAGAHVARGAWDNWFGKGVKFFIRGPLRDALDIEAEVYHSRSDDFSFGENLLRNGMSFLPDLIPLGFGAKLGHKGAKLATKVLPKAAGPLATKIAELGIQGATTFGLHRFIDSAATHAIDYQNVTPEELRSLVGFVRDRAPSILAETGTSAAMGAIFSNASHGISHLLPKIPGMPSMLLEGEKMLTPTASLAVKPLVDASLLTGLGAAFSGQAPTLEDFGMSCALFYGMHGAAFVGGHSVNAYREYRNPFFTAELKLDFPRDPNHMRFVLPGLMYEPPFIRQIELYDAGLTTGGDGPWHFRDPGIVRPKSGLIRPSYNNYNRLYMERYAKDPYTGKRLGNKIEKVESISFLDDHYSYDPETRDLKKVYVSRGRYDPWTNKLPEHLSLYYNDMDGFWALYEVLEHSKFVEDPVFARLRQFAGAATEHKWLKIILESSRKNLDGALGRYQRNLKSSSPHGTASLVMWDRWDLQRNAGIFQHEVYSAYADFAALHPEAPRVLSTRDAFNLNRIVESVDLDLRSNYPIYDSRGFDAPRNYVYEMMKYARQLEQPEEILPHFVTAYTDFPGQACQLFTHTSRLLAEQLSFVGQYIEGRLDGRFKPAVMDGIPKLEPHVFEHSMAAETPIIEVGSTSVEAPKRRYTWEGGGFFRQERAKLITTTQKSPLHLGERLDGSKTLGSASAGSQSAPASSESTSSSQAKAEGSPLHLGEHLDGSKTLGSAPASSQSAPASSSKAKAERSPLHLGERLDGSKTLGSAPASSQSALASSSQAKAEGSPLHLGERLDGSKTLGSASAGSQSAPASSNQAALHLGDRLGTDKTLGTSGDSKGRGLSSRVSKGENPSSIIAGNVSSTVRSSQRFFSQLRHDPATLEDSTLSDLHKVTKASPPDDGMSPGGTR